MDKKDWEELNRISLQEELMAVTVEDMMKDGLPRETAQAIYDARHGIGNSEPIPIDEYIKKLERMRRDLDSRE